MDESGKGADSYARNDKGSAELTNQLFSLLYVFNMPGRNLYTSLPQGMIVIHVVVVVVT